MTTALTEELHDPVSVQGRVPDASLFARLYGSKTAHRLVPASVALALVGAIGPAVRQRRNSAERRAAQRFMADLLLYTPRAAEAEGLAERWLVEKSRQRELFWRPWLLKRSRVIGREHWDAAHAGGRGCVLALGHIGATWALPRIFALHGLPVHVVAAAHYWEDLPAGYEGFERLHRRREYAQHGQVRMLRNDGPPERLLRLIEAGETVATAFDVGGSAITPFLGRSVALAGGVSTLPFKTGAMVLPLLPQRRGTRVDLHFFPPIDPADHRDPRSLRTEIARTFERIVLESPETVELAWYPSPLVTEVPPGELG